MGYLYTSLVIAASIALRHIILAWWERFKERESLRETPMKLRKGVYVPWGRVERIERAINITVAVWAIWMVMMIGVGLHYKFVLHRQPDIVTILSGGLL